MTDEQIQAIARAGDESRRIASGTIDPVLLAPLDVVADRLRSVGYAIGYSDAPLQQAIDHIARIVREGYEAGVEQCEADRGTT